MVNLFSYDQYIFAFFKYNIAFSEGVKTFLQIFFYDI